MNQVPHFEYGMNEHQGAEITVVHSANAEMRLLPNVVLFATTPAIRAGIQQLLQAAGGNVLASSSSTTALEGLIRLHPHLTIVCDAESRSEAFQVMLRYQSPLLVLAVSRQQRQLVEEDMTLSAPRCSVVDATAEDAVLVITEALITIATGESFIHLPASSTSRRRPSSIVPPSIVRLFRKAGLPLRCIELVWLDATGCSSVEIAQRLFVNKGTVCSYWKRAQRRMMMDRASLRVWVQMQLEDAVNAPSNIA